MISGEKMTARPIDRLLSKLMDILIERPKSKPLRPWWIPPAEPFKPPKKRRV